MDIKKYLASGILELYVLGRLSDSDRQDVEQNARQYPEIASEIEQIESALETLAQEMAPEVSPEILTKTLRQIRSQAANTGADSTAQPRTTGGRIPGWIPWAIALLGLIGAVWMWWAYQNSSSELSALQSQYAALEEACDTAAAEQAATANILATLSDPNTKNIILNGTDNAPNKQAVVFYNPTAEETLFTATNLPTPPAGKQYQLWAIDADGPKSMGVLELELDGSAVLSVDHFPAVAAFAITLEDLGGKPTPDLSQLQVIGEVA